VGAGETLQSQTVVIVDDDPAVCAALRLSFELDGLSVITFPSAEAMLAAPALPGKGCIVLDYRLPGLDGLELLTRLRERGFTLSAVLITTAPPPAVRQRAAREDVEIVEKPLLSNALMDAVHARLGQVF
jgi:two-component system response regulator FixJ